MESPNAHTVEEMLQRRLGVTVDDMVSTGTDRVDELARRAVDSGIPVDRSLDQGLNALVRLAAPENMAALQQLVDALPQLAELAAAARHLPDFVAGVTDVVDEMQPRMAERGVDIERAATNGLNAFLEMGSALSSEQVRRLVGLLNSNVLSPEAVESVGIAACALRDAGTSSGDEPAGTIGLFGLMRQLRDPQIQRSLKFAIRFAKSFGQRLESQQPCTDKQS